MTGVSIDITTKGDVTGLKNIEQASAGMFDRLKRKFNELQAKDPAQDIADKQLQQRQFSNLERKASELERKIATARIDQLQYGVKGAAEPGGSSYINELRRQREIVSMQQKLVGAPVPAGPTGMGIAGRIGRKGLKYGSMLAGGLGAYSLLSNIFGEMGGVDERNIAYATSMLASRSNPNITEDLSTYGTQGTGLSFGKTKPFLELGNTLRELGKTSLITAIDMGKMLDVAKELGDFSARTDNRGLARAVNMGKMIGVDPSVLNQLFTGGLQRGNFQAGGQYSDIAMAMMLNPAMMHRSTESLQAMQQVLSGTMHGTQGLGAFGTFNLLDTMNRSGNRAYMGAGGAQAMLRMDQAFRSGGNENMQYFQTLALNPAFQEKNARMVAAGANVQVTGTNYGTGRYDQIITDIFKGLGAFATPEDAIKMMSGVEGVKGGLGYTGFGKYIQEKFAGSMKKTNIERMFDVYRATYGSEGNEGSRLFMTAQLAKDMGVSFADVGVMERATKDTDFMRAAAKGSLSPTEIAKRYKEFETAGGGSAVAFLEMKAEDKREKIAAAKELQDMKDALVPLMTASAKALTNFLEPISTGVTTISNFFKTAEGPSAVEVSDRNRQAVKETFSGFFTSMSIYMTKLDTYLEKLNTRKPQNGKPGELIVDDL